METTSYDYIIIGAGSAGCVLADRLTADGKHKVLLLEAGGSDARFWVKVPLGYAFTYADPTLNWGYHSAPDAGLAGRATYWPRGRVVGGSSTINAMAYVRGLAHDFDDWQAAGATGWGWSEVRKTYEAMERSLSPAGDHGTGPVCVSDLSRRMNPFSARFLQAATDMGWSTPQDMNADGAQGLSYYRSTTRHGRRWSAADAFLRPALRRPNLRLVTRAQVDRIEITDKRATGVTYRTGDQSHRATARATARAEVILCAGAVNSPHLLHLSGIGDPAHLRPLGIAMQHDAPQVGQGLQDHLALAYYYAATEPTLNNWLGNRFGQMLAGALYLSLRRGPLGVPVNQVGGFVRSTADSPTPDLQIYCNPASYSYSSKPGASPEIDADPGFLLCAQPCRPTSRGSITTTSADPRSAPLIQPNSLSTIEDAEAMLRAARTIRALAQTPTMRRVTRAAHLPDVTRMSDEDILADARARASTVFHPTCTCRMGADARTSALDPTLKVHGLRGLRVVDASAFPNITSGNTNAPTLMLAMRAADMILSEGPP